MRQRYLIALGSNMRVPGVGGPRQVLAAALVALEAEQLAVETASPVIVTAPLGPSSRLYANAAAIVRTDMSPPDLLALLHRIEGTFGRTRRGRCWRPRPLDLDIVMWSGGAWLSPRLTVPHPEFRARGFVMGPAAEVASDWRDPVTRLTLRQLHARLTRPRPLPR